MNHRKLAICTPCYDGRVHTGYCIGVEQTKAYFGRQGVQVAQFVAEHSANLPRLRNSLASNALDWGAESIMWIDSDVGFNPDDIWKLWQSDKAIIGAGIQKRPKFYGTKPEVAFKPLENGTVQHHPDGLVKVGALPTAFVMTQRVVFDELRNYGIAKPLANRDGKCSPTFCNYFWYELIWNPDLKGYIDDGEDYYFMRKAVECGFDVWLDPSLRPVHHEGRMRLECNFMDLFGEVKDAKEESPRDTQRHLGQSESVQGV